MYTFYTTRKNRPRGGWFFDTAQLGRLAVVHARHKQGLRHFHPAEHRAPPGHPGMAQDPEYMQTLRTAKYVAVTIDGVWPDFESPGDYDGVYEISDFVEHGDGSWEFRYVRKVGAVMTESRARGGRF